MPAFGEQELGRLLERRNTCLSLYLPMERAGGDTRQNPIRLKNALNEAEDLLVAEGLRTPEASKLLAPATGLLDDSLFWQSQSDGLALFVAPDFFEGYREPLPFKDRVVVGSRFYVKPLLPLLEDGEYFVLALSQGSVRLLAGSRSTLDELPANELPEDLASVVSDEVMERQLQFRSVDIGGGGRQAMFHGHGASGEVQHDQLLRYFRAIDSGLAEMLGSSKAPLILAAVEYLHPVYREANTYPGLLGAGITGNPEELSADELHARTWARAREHYAGERRSAAEQAEGLLGTGRATADVSEVVRAAHEGRVAVLFVDPGAEVWGSFDPATATVALDDEPAAENGDLLDQAAAWALRNGGVVYASVDDGPPGGGAVAALLRY